MLLMSTHNIGFHGEIRKNIMWILLLSGPRLVRVFDHVCELRTNFHVWLITCVVYSAKCTNMKLLFSGVCQWFLWAIKVIWVWKGRFYNYSRFLLSQSPRVSLKHFEKSVPRYIKFAELRKKLNNHISQLNSNLTPEVRDILKILWKRREIATVFCYLLLDLHV